MKSGDTGGFRAVLQRCIQAGVSERLAGQANPEGAVFGEPALASCRAQIAVERGGGLRPEWRYSALSALASSDRYEALVEVDVGYFQRDDFTGPQAGFGH